jgi:hypothetical protein
MNKTWIRTFYFDPKLTLHHSMDGIKHADPDYGRVGAKLCRVVFSFGRSKVNKKEV